MGHAKEKFYDLDFEQLEDGTIRLEQRDYCGESVIIDLHPLQAAHIARQAGGIASPETLPRGLAQRVLRLKEKAFGLFQMLASVPCFPPRDEETEDVIAAYALLQEFDYLIDDFGLSGECVTPCHANVTDNAERNGKSPPISVTHNETRKRGRPQSGGALSNSERQKAHRAKKAQVKADSAPALEFELEGAYAAPPE